MSEGMNIASLQYTIRSSIMRIFIMALFLALGFTFSAIAQDKDQIRERLKGGKEQVKSGVTIVKDAKEQARQLREQVKAGQMTKEQAKAQMQQMRNQVRSAKEQIKAGREAIRESRRQLREMRKAGKP
jgi:polyhydroxyalkanoate synthesis regulator phasin